MRFQPLNVIAAFVLTSWCAGVVNAAPLEDGYAAFQRGDYTAAFQLWLPIAEEGDANAQAAIGFLYEQGRGVPRDDAAAALWFRAAAAQGDASAQFALGNMSILGRSVSRAEAFKWFSFAAEQGHADAQLSLGAMYEVGVGGLADYVTAHVWFSLAAKQGNQTASRQRDLVAERMTPDQITEAQRLAREWKPKAE